MSQGPITMAIVNGLKIVRATGKTNMFDSSMVKLVAREEHRKTPLADLAMVALWIEGLEELSASKRAAKYTDMLAILGQSLEEG